MTRIMIIGGPGSGKSTLARALGDATGLPVHHMDRIHHLSGWVMRPTPERIAMARAVEDTEEWIFEGGLSATYATRAARADLVVFLDLPMLQRLWRVVGRTFRHYGKVRPDVSPGSPERFSWDFIWYIVSTAGKNRRRHAALLATLPRHKALTLRSQRAIDDWRTGAIRTGALA